MAEWVMKKLKDIADFNPRESLTKGVVAKKIAMDKLQPFCRDIPGYELEPFSGGTKFRNGDTIMARITPCLENGKTAKVAVLEEGEVGFGSTEYIVFRAKDGVDEDFIYYLVCSPLVREPAIKSMVGSSGRQRVQTDVVRNLEIMVPDYDEQKRISGLLKSLDDKIAANTEVNKNLEQQAQALYKSWFVDFSAFGGTVPNDWQIYHLVDFLPVITGKKNANVSSNQGKYPFFSCSQDYAWTNNYSFDGNAILVAGNGDFNVKFYSGKFEAYQRTYVLIPYEPKYTAWLFYAVQYHLSSITSAARGSVIKFITKGNLEDFEFVAPKIPLSLPVIDIFNAINRRIAANREENLTLGILRDTLLSKLMSGELDVSDIDI